MSPSLWTGTAAGRRNGTCRGLPDTAQERNRPHHHRNLRATEGEALTLYAFSVENWRRPKAEIDFLMQLLREYLRKEMPLLQKNNIRMRFLGRIRSFPRAAE